MASVVMKIKTIQKTAYEILDEHQDGRFTVRKRFLTYRTAMNALVNGIGEPRDWRGGEVRKVVMIDGAWETFY